MPKEWQIKYRDLTFNIKPMGFKHTGLFPEQAVNWDWMIDKIQKEKREIKVLNLFAYTGGATVACLSAGASVCHVDSSKGMTAWAKENVVSSGLEKSNVRYIVDDVFKFVNREIRRGNKYDAIKGFIDKFDDDYKQMFFGEYGNVSEEEVACSYIENLFKNLLENGGNKSFNYGLEEINDGKLLKLCKSLVEWC